MHSIYVQQVSSNHHVPNFRRLFQVPSENPNKTRVPAASDPLLMVNASHVSGYCPSQQSGGGATTQTTKVQLPGTDAYFPLLAYIMPEHVPTWLSTLLSGAGVCTKHSLSLSAWDGVALARDDTSRSSSSRGSFFFWACC